MLDRHACPHGLHGPAGSKKSRLPRPVRRSRHSLFSAGDTPAPLLRRPAPGDRLNDRASRRSVRREARRINDLQERALRDDGPQGCSRQGVPKTEREARRGFPSFIRVLKSRPAQRGRKAALLCSDRLFPLSSLSKLEVARLTNKRAWKRVNSHKNAKLTPRGREEVVDDWTAWPLLIWRKLTDCQKMEKSLPVWWHRGTCGQNLPSPKLSEQADRKDLRRDFLSATEAFDRGAIATRRDLVGVLSFAPCVNLATRVLPLWRQSFKCGDQWEKPGKILHLDIKRLGRINGVEHQTDNGACYASRKYHKACREFGIQHNRPLPYRPQTNSNPNDLSRRN